MSLAGVLLAYWLTLAALAFAALTALGRFAARGAGEAEVRVMLAGHDETRGPLEAGLASYMGIAGRGGSR